MNNTWGNPGRARWAMLLLASVMALGRGAGTGQAAGPASFPSGFHRVELAPHFTERLADVPSSDPWQSIPSGVQQFHGVPFDIEGRCEITGMLAARDNNFLPSEITGIAVGRKARTIHLLHVVSHPEDRGAPLAKIVLHYANGESESFRLAYGVHTRALYRARGERDSTVEDPNSQPAWEDVEDVRDRDRERRGSSTRLFQTALLNPRPDAEITRLDFVSLFSRASPCLVAVTLAETAFTTGMARSDARSLRKATELPDEAYRREFKVTARAADGSAVSNLTASLTLTDDRFTFYFGTNRADAAGRITLPYPAQQTVAYTLLVRAPGFIPVTLSASRTNGVDLPEDLTAKLNRGAPVGGLVTDTEGRPISQVEVSISQLLQEAPRKYLLIDYDTVISDSAGKWSSTSVPGELKGFHFEVRHPAYRGGTWIAGAPTNTPAPSTNRTTTTTGARTTTTNRVIRTASASVTRSVEPDALRTSKAVFALTPSIRLAGTIQDEAGRGVPGASLYLFEDANDSRPIREFAADRTGEFQVYVPDPDEMALAVVAKGFTPQYQSISVTPGMRPMEIRLAKSEPITGYVREGTNALPNALVKLDSWHSSSLLRLQARTDDKGKFTMEGAPEDTATYSISATNYSNYRYSTQPRNNELSFTVRRPFMAFGKVLDAQTRLPVAEFNIIQGYRYNTNEPVRWQRYNRTRGRNGEYSHRLSDYGSSTEHFLSIDAAGYLPQASRPFSSGAGGWHTNDFLLEKGRGIHGVVRTPDGQPASGATLVLGEPGDYLSMEDSGQVRFSSSYGESVRADKEGRFEFRARLDPRKIVVSHPSGFADLDPAMVQKSGEIKLEAWGTVRGVVQVGHRTNAIQTVVLQASSGYYGDDERYGPHLNIFVRTQTDREGRFTFQRVPPGERRVSLEYKIPRNNNDEGSIPLSHSVGLEVKPGGTNDVLVGGPGRTVVGRVRTIGMDPTEVNWRRDTHQISLRLSPVEMPSMSTTFKPNATPAEQRAQQAEYEQRMRQWSLSPAGRNYARQQRNYVLLFETNGTFEIESVPPGSYDLNISLYQREDLGQNSWTTKHLGSVNRELVVPTGKLDEPFDMGAFDLVLRRQLRIGQRAPPFETKTTLDSKPVKLDDFRGRPVVLYFHATWAGSLDLDTRVLSELQETYGKENKLAIIGLNFDYEAATAEQYAKTNGAKWVQCYGGRWSDSTLPALYGVEGVPTAVVISSDGFVTSRNIRGSSIRTAARNAVTAGERAGTR